MNSSFRQAEQLALFKTAPHRCSYLPDQQATTLFADPSVPKNPTIQKYLSEFGFRRSGGLIYRPNCQHCNACTPVRIPVREFRPDRAQRRTIKINSDLNVCALAPIPTDEHFDLYRRYLEARHGAKEDDTAPASLVDFLTADWADTVFYEFRLHQRLLAVAVADRWEGAQSAVYTFFDPDYPQRSLGRYAVLFQIDVAHSDHRDWLYLGYWISDCRKMKYKLEYQPLEYLIKGRWQTMSAARLS